MNVTPSVSHSIRNASMPKCIVSYSYSLLDMKRNCAPLCKSCDYLSVEGRCPIDPNAPTAWQPGDLSKMFEKLTGEPYLSKYQVQTLSSPATDGPWVITMENMLSEDEAERLIEFGAVEGYERSTDVGKMKADGTTERQVDQRIIRVAP